ncbi:RNA polymerase sigma factor [Plantactinospora sp. CA-294935]|uniref:RNA polymerase sigma factor n=1 Tax=Plantactinospora sp. CA-294935 TaxID=3240012 RepID=UPI003D928C7F
MEAEVLAAARTGDQRAWDAIVDRYTGLLWSVARSFRLDAADAADVVQLTWLRLVEHLDDVVDPDRLGAWLATTVRRECLQLLRRRRERPAAVDDWLASVPDPGPPVDARMLRVERDAGLWRALHTLSGRCQQLLRVLMAVPPPSYADVSAALDMPIGGIGPARQRCLAALRRALDETPLSPGDRRDG